MSRLDFDQFETGHNNKTESQCKKKPKIKSENKSEDSAFTADTEDEIFTRPTKEQIEYEKTAKKQKSKLNFDENLGDEDATDNILDDEIPSDDRFAKRKAKWDKRAEKYTNKSDDLKEKIPKHRKLKLDREFTDEGKVKRKITTYKVDVKRGYKGNIFIRGTKATLKSPFVLSHRYAHRKLREIENEDNNALKVVHKAERTTERALGYGYRKTKNYIKDTPYRRVDKNNKKLMKARFKSEYNKVLQENPQLQKKQLSKWIQKQQLKRKYAKAYRDSKKGVKTTIAMKNFVTAVAHKVAQVIAAQKTAVIVVVLFIAVLLFIIIGAMSSGFMLAGAGNSVVATMYPADTEEINNSDLHYSELETDLEDKVDSIREDYPDYDEYNIDLDPIGHSPYELLAYLSAKFNDFEYSAIQNELNSLFAEQYDLDIESEVEIRYRTERRTGTNADGSTYSYTVQVPYEWHILNVTLTTKPLNDIIEERLTDEEMKNRYDVYMQTLGARQTFGNPFRENWLSRISSPYGYRIHPITGKKTLHRGIDIAYPQGTPIYAVHEGTVITATKSDSYGNYVVIQDDKGFISKYAHCHTLNVRVGDVVTKETQIGTVGTTGESTGNHLHLEVLYEGEYLNPAFFVETGANEFDINELLD